jgi:hypothetical protein
MRTKSRPEIEIADKRLAFSIQTPSIEPSYKTAPNQVKLSISQKVQGLCKNFRLQHVLNLVTLTVRRPQHPYLTWCSLIFLHGNFSRLVPRDSNLGHHTYIRVYEIKLELPAPAPARARVTKSNPCFHFTVIL